MTEQIRRIPSTELEEDCAESWERLTDDPDIRGVDASMITLGEQPYWSVGVAVAEFLREDPLEAELRQQMAAALQAVDGVESVWEEDREVWGVTGAPAGEPWYAQRPGSRSSGGVRASVRRELVVVISSFLLDRDLPLWLV